MHRRPRPRHLGVSRGEGVEDRPVLGRGPASVSELGEPLAMSLAAVVQHVRILEGSGLVRTQKLGRTRTCSLNPVTLRSAERWISERRTFVERRLNRLAILDMTALGRQEAWEEPGDRAPLPH
jgi:DNA-binding transcriptional ArsR family regulator